jgi:uncharacterized protein
MLSVAVERVVDVCSRRAWYVLLLAVVLTAMTLAYTVHHIRIDTDSTKLFSPDLPWRQREVAFDAAFPQRVNQIVIVVDGATPELAEEVAAALAQSLAQRSDLFRQVYRPDGGPFFDRNGLLFLSREELARSTEHMIAAQPFLGSLAADPSLRGLLDALSLAMEGVSRGEAKLDALARSLAALADTLERVVAGNPAPLSWRSLITGETMGMRELRRFIFVQPVLDFEALQPGAIATEAIRSAVRQLRPSQDGTVRVRLTGPVPLSDEEFATLADRALVNATATVLMVGVLLWLALRSGRMILAIAVTLVVGMLATTALSLLVIGPFNLISVAFAVLFVGLGVDFGIQFCVRYRAERRAHDDLFAALRTAGAAVAGPLSLAAASTAAGFYALAPTQYRGVSELGLIAGTGMIIALITTLTVLPALLSLLRPPAEKLEVGFPAAASLDRFLVTHRREVLITAAVLAAGCLSLLPRVRFDFNPLHLRSPKVESMATLLDLMKDPEATPNTIDVLAPDLTAAVMLAKRLAALPEVAQVVTLASYVPPEQAQKLALISDAWLLLDPTLNPAEVRPAPTDEENIRAMSRAADQLQKAASVAQRPAAADARRLAEVLRALMRGNPAQRAQASAVLMPGLQATLNQVRAALQAGPVTLQTLPPELVRDWVATDGRARVEVFPAGDSNDNETLRRFVGAVREVTPDATGAPVSIQESSRTIVRAFLQAGLWAFVSITVLLAAVLRRAADVMLTLAPLLLAGLLTLGLCVVLGEPFNFANIIALPLLFGIGVAFTIYFVMARRAGVSGLLQSSLARAVLFSALTTATAFGSLSLSSHPGTASMGRLLALSLACTLASALFFLPALLASKHSR